MEKIKWKYDHTRDEWREKEVLWFFTIQKRAGIYFLHKDNNDVVGSFKKLSSAKTVANLLRNG